MKWRLQIKQWQLDFSKLHFCREDKVRYRKHLTFGVLISTVLGMVGMAWGIGWLCHASMFMNAWTAVIWIWE